MPQVKNARRKRRFWEFADSSEGDLSSDERAALRSDEADGSGAADDQCTGQQATEVLAMHRMIDTQTKELHSHIQEAEELQLAVGLPPKVVIDAKQAVLEGDAALATITALKESNKKSLYQSSMEDCEKAKVAMQSAKKILTVASQQAISLWERVDDLYEEGSRYDALYYSMSD